MKKYLIIVLIFFGVNCFALFGLGKKTPDEKFKKLKNNYTELKDDYQSDVKIILKNIEHRPEKYIEKYLRKV